MTRLDELRARLKVRVLLPAALTPADREAWQSLRSAHAGYASPLFSPDFAEVTSAARPDARVALIEDADGLVCAFAFYARPDGLGRPIGAPFADYSGPVTRQSGDLSLRDIVALSGLAGWRSLSLIDPWNQFTADRTGERRSLAIHLEGVSTADYLEARRAAHPKRFKNFRRLDAQIERDGHALVLDHGPANARLRERLFALKSRQYRASGLVDLTVAAQSRAILDSVARHPGGFQTSLWTGDTLIAAHFGFRDGTSFHPWIAAYNPDFAHYSPCNLLLKRVVESMPEMGVVTYDLADGSDHYKKYYTNSGMNVYQADVTGYGPRADLLKAGSALWRLAGTARDPSAASRLRRRIDQAAISDFRLGARARDLVDAIATRSRVRASSPHGDPAPEA